MGKSFKHSRHIGIESVDCFVCAPKKNNPKSLDLEFVETENGAETRFLLPSGFQSYPGFLHGGIVSAILDETMAYAGVFRYDKFPLTRRMSLSYRRGVEAEKEYVCRSELVEVGEAGFSARAVVSLAGRGSFVLSEGDFILPTKEQAARMMPGANHPNWSRFFR